MLKSELFLLEIDSNKFLTRPLILQTHKFDVARALY